MAQAIRLSCLVTSGHRQQHGEDRCLQAKQENAGGRLNIGCSQRTDLESAERDEQAADAGFRFEGVMGGETSFGG